MRDSNSHDQAERARSLWFQNEAHTHFFRYAAWLERDGYFVSDSARKSDLENWTVHLSESLLSENDQENLFVSQAPLRAVILTSVLQRSLEELAISPPSNGLEKRLQRITKEGLLKAQETLLSLLSATPRGDSLDSYDFAFSLLLLIGTEEQLASLPLCVANLANEPHTNSVIGKLGMVRTLEELNLSQTLISREGTGFLADLNNLSKLDLSDTKIMSSSLVPLRNLLQLEDLNLSGTQINHSSLATFSHLTGLRRLDIRNTALVSAKDSLERLLPECRVIVGR